jgi:CRISPR system Cascade subunit CasB
MKMTDIANPQDGPALLPRDARPLWRRARTGPKTDPYPFDGGDLAALRRGAGREPGSVPEMWPFYTRLREDGRLSRELRAEHHALVLFGFHQQSERMPVHEKGGSNVGGALAELVAVGRHTPEAVGRRFAAAAQAQTLDALATHLRYLVALLKERSSTIHLDYDLLFGQLEHWDSNDERWKTQRKWAAAFYRHVPKPTESADDAA